jgi:hypothetical protein
MEPSPKARGRWKKMKTNAVPLLAIFEKKMRLEVPRQQGKSWLRASPDISYYF